MPTKDRRNRFDNLPGVIDWLETLRELGPQKREAGRSGASARERGLTDYWVRHRGTGQEMFLETLKEIEKGNREWYKLIDYGVGLEAITPAGLQFLQDNTKHVALKSRPSPDPVRKPAPKPMQEPASEPAQETVAAPEPAPEPVRKPAPVSPRRSLNDAQKGITPQDITSLCDAGKEAWSNLGPRGRKAIFEWRGKKYVATHTTLQLLINTTDGKPVASRYDL